MNDRWAGFGSAAASLMFIWAIVRQYFPFLFDNYAAKHAQKLIAYVYPYIQITISEYTGERMERSTAYSAVEAYLAATCSQAANKLKAELGKDSSNLVLSMDDNEEVEDKFQNAKLWWLSTKKTPRTQVVSFYPTPEERRSYKLTFHKSHRDLVVSAYLSHVIKEGKEVGVRNRQRKMYINNPASKGYGRGGGAWSHVVFEHPATFDTLAMSPAKKREIKLDLDAFKNGKDFYARIGKAWKRGYLLYGPPGTGKSTMIAAMANYMDYDIYDLELTTVLTNTDLRKLLIETTSKSIVVLEDIDCSLDLTGRRKHKPKNETGDGNGSPVPPPGEEKDETSKLTLSGLLNFIDGLWSACSGERLIVFTTNHIEKLDPALIRRGRMDKHIEMSYCEFESFKVFAHGYLGVDSHDLFETIEKLLGETKISPADVAENLMPKSPDEDAETCLSNLIEALKKSKEEEEKALTKAKKEEEKALTKAKEEEEKALTKSKEEEEKALTKAKEEEEKVSETQQGPDITQQGDETTENA